MLRDRGSHDSNRSGSGHQYVLSQDGKRECGVYRVAEGIKDGGDVKQHALVMPPDIRHGQGNVLGEGAGAIDPDPLRMGTEVTPPGKTIPTAAADDVTLAADDF